MNILESVHDVNCAWASCSVWSFCLIPRVWLQSRGRTRIFSKLLEPSVIIVIPIECIEGVHRATMVRGWVLLVRARRVQSESGLAVSPLMLTVDSHAQNINLFDEQHFSL